MTKHYSPARRYVAAGTLRNLRTIALIIAAYLIWVREFSQPSHAIVTTVLALIAIGLLIEPFHAKFTKSLKIEPENLVYKQGSLFPTTRTIPLASITTTHVESPWHLHMFKLHALTITAEGVTNGAVTVEGLSEDDVREIQKILNSREREERPRQDKTLEKSEKPKEPAAEASEPATGEVSFKATGSDIAATVIGNPAFLALTLLATLSSVVDGFENLKRLLPLPDVTSPWSEIVAVMIILVIATGAAYSQFHGLTLKKTDDGAWTYSYGLVERVEHRISSDSIAAVNVSASIIDVLLGRRRLTLRSAVDKASGNVLRFPSIPHRDVNGILHALTNHTIGDLNLPVSRKVGVTTSLILFTTGATAFVTTLFSSGVWGMVAAVFALIISTALTNYFTARTITSASSDHAVWAKSSWRHSIEILDTKRIYANVTYHLPMTPFAHREITGYAHQPITLRYPTRTLRPRET